MSRSLKVYYPVNGAQNCSTAIATILQGCTHVVESPPAMLHLNALKCFFIRFKGSLMQSRAPFVYPLMDQAYHKYYLTERSVYPCHAFGADWVFLGGDFADFCTKLFQNVRLNNVQTVYLQPFTDVTGALLSARQPNDVSLTLVKKPCFHNDVHVQKHKEMLLSRPPEEWANKDYPLTMDRYDSIAHHVRGNLQIKPRTIIELGCGLGNTTSRMAREFPDAKVIGYDFSPHSIEVCRKTFKEPNLEFRLGDFTTPLPHDDNSVDLIVSIEATNMSQSPVGTAGECCRVLSDEGLLVNCSLSESSYVYWDFPASLFLPVHMNTFATDWYSVARQAGYGFQLSPWCLASFTFIACRTHQFRDAHHVFASSRNGEEIYRLYHDRFAMVIGKHVPTLKPMNEHDHLCIRSYPEYVRRCLAERTPEDGELNSFTDWSRELVEAELKLLPGGVEFVNAWSAAAKEECLVVE